MLSLFEELKLKFIHETVVLFFFISGTPTFGSVFEGKQAKLVAMIDVEHGLLRKLEALGVITTTHRQAIEVFYCYFCCC